MKKKLVVGLVALFLAVPALADKPEWAGEGKPAAEQKEAHREAMQVKEGYKFEDDGSKKVKKEKIKKEKLKKEKNSKEKKAKQGLDDDEGQYEQGSVDKLKGLEKQADKKAEQERKELGKGSDTGQAAREESKKWWKFWE